MSDLIKAIMFGGLMLSLVLAEVAYSVRTGREDLLMDLLGAAWRWACESFIGVPPSWGKKDQRKEDA